MDLPQPDRLGYHLSLADADCDLEAITASGRAVTASLRTN